MMQTTYKETGIGGGGMKLSKEYFVTDIKKY